MASIWATDEKIRSPKELMKSKLFMLFYSCYKILAPKYKNGSKKPDNYI